jgi:hypothetical protein
MTAIGWVLLAVLAAAVVWLVFAMIGLLREVAVLRAAIGALTQGPIELAAGVSVGTLAPAWTIDTPGGEVASSAFEGRRHVMVFADAECRTCDALVPDVVHAAGDRALPPVVVIGREGSDLPDAWRGPGVVAGREHGSEVSDAFGVDVSPHVFVLDEEGAVVAQGGAMTLGDVEALVRDAQGIRIVPGRAID